MEAFINVKKNILFTPNYPKEGIEFINLIHALGHPDVMVLARIACANLCIDKDCVIVGVPTRGCIVAQMIAIASGRSPSVVQLQKKGVGTPLPGTIDLCKSGTAYADDSKATSFLLDPIGLGMLEKARRVIICDDVSESGSTMAAIARAIVARNPQLENELSDALPNVILLPFVQIIQKHVSTSFSVYPIMVKNAKGIVPGSAFLMRPHLLTTVRGVPSAPTGSTMVFSAPSMVAHAMSYVTNHTNCFMGDVVWGRFTGGCPNIRYTSYDKCDVLFIYDASNEDPAQNFVVRELARTCTGAMKIAIPYMPQATMERADVSGTLATAKSFFDVLCDGLPIVVGGRIVVEVLDIHQTGEMFYVPSNVQFVSRTLLRSLVPQSAKIVAFPDDGAYKRFSHQFRGFTQVICEKRREGEKRIISVKETVGPLPISGSDIVLVDDLTRTYGTLVETAAVIKALGATSVHAIFVHADAEPGRTHAFVNNPHIDLITTTDSCPEKARLLKMLGGNKVIIRSAFDGGCCSTFYANIQMQHALGVASTDESKMLAAFGGMTLPYKCTITDKMRTKLVKFIVCMPVESSVPEQPVGDAQGIEGATNRIAFFHLVLPNIVIVAFESFMRIRDDGIIVDTACALVSDDMEHPGFEESAIPPQDIAKEAIEKGQLVGEVLMKKYNLSSKSAWIDFFATRRRSRTEQLMASLLNIKRYDSLNAGYGGR